ncbi:MAG: InlB B-repeat-containing protein, partial [Ruminococcus sp.]
MKKSFAENCIRYISTATALILALAMLCCANFSASAKDLGSNLAITDTTLLLQDINTTTNTTPAKTKDLIASGAGVELESVGAYTGIIYVDTKNLTSSWSSVYLHYWGGDSSTWPGVTMTSVGDGIYSYDLSSKSGVTGCIFHNNSGTQTGDLTIPSSDNAMFVLNADGKSGTWSTYSGGSSTTSTWTLRGDSPIDWTTGTAMTTSGTNKVACSVELAKNTTYEFKLHDGSNWYGNTGTMTSDNCTGWTFSSSVGNNAKITTTNAGTYVFTLDTSTKKLSVTYPATYTVTFNANGHGTAPSSQNVSSGGTATEPTAPTASGYTFGGWYKESECTNAYDFSTAVTGNITLYAKWTANATSEVSEDILAILNGTKTQAYFGHPSSGWQTAIYIKSGSNSTNKTQIGTTKVSNVDCYYADFTLDSTTNLSSYAISDNSTWAGKSVGVNEIVVGGAFYYIYSSNDNENGKIDPTTAQTTLGATSFTVGTTDKLSVTTKATATTSSTGNALKYQYYIKNGTNYLRLGSTDITASTSDTTTEFDISTLPKGTYELITMLYDGHIYYVSDTTETDTFTISDSY